MKLPLIFTQKKTVIIEVVVLAIFLSGIYYLYTTIGEQSPTTTVPANQQIVMQYQNLTLFLKTVDQGKISFEGASFMNSSSLVKQLQDFSETILPTVKRGRDNPFAPYK